MLDWIVAFIIAFSVTIVLTPIFIRKLIAAEIIGHDVHKSDRPAVPEMGGITLAFGLAAGAFAAMPFFIGNVYLLGGLSTILLAAMIGICDDMFGIRQKTKSFLPVFAAIPLMAMSAGEHFVILPFVGLVNFGLLYPLLLIPLGITVAANSANMLAGYNGLESGLGAIASFFLGFIAVLTGHADAAIIMFALCGACLAFLRFNRYPSRIFLGDVGAFVIGSAVATAAIIGNLETFGLLVLGPHIINGFLTSFDIARKKPIQKFSTVKNGILVPPERRFVNALYFELQRLRPMTEKQVVWAIWLIGIAFGLLALGLAFSPFGFSTPAALSG